MTFDEIDHVWSLSSSAGQAHLEQNHTNDLGNKHNIVSLRRLLLTNSLADGFSRSMIINLITTERN